MVEVVLHYLLRDYKPSPSPIDTGNVIRALCGSMLLLVGLSLGPFTLILALRQTGATEEPEDISLRALIAREPAGNPHVRLSGFTIGRAMTCTSDRSPIGTQVIIPIFPSDEQGPPQAVPAVVRSFRKPDRELLGALWEKKRVEGMIGRRLQPSLPFPAKKELQAQYPGTDFSTCIVVEEGTSPTSAVLLNAGFALAVACLPLAIYLLVRVVRPKRSSAIDASPADDARVAPA